MTQKLTVDVLPTSASATGYAIYQKYYPSELCLGDLVRVQGGLAQQADEKQLLQRIAASYQHANKRYDQSASGVWSIIESHKAPVHKAVMAGDIDTLGAMLREPATTMLFHGFDQPTSNSIKNMVTKGWATNYHAFCLGSLRRIAEAIGAIPMAYPEGYGVDADVISNEPLHVNDVIDAIEQELGYSVNFPNIFIEEWGLDTKRGVASYRAIQSLFQALRIKDLSPTRTASDPSVSALEIGGGTGRTAFFAYHAGVQNYSIVDLPISGLVQAYFLGMTLGQDKICLDGEPYTENAVKVFSPPVLPTTGPYDVAASFDAIVEFSEEVASGYLDFVTANANTFLSVNRESKSFSVRSLLKDRNIASTRTPYWLRHGYAEEIAVLRS